MRLKHVARAVRAVVAGLNYVRERGPDLQLVALQQPVCVELVPILIIIILLIA